MQRSKLLLISYSGPLFLSEGVCFPNTLELGTGSPLIFGHQQSQLPPPACSLKKCTAKLIHLELSGYSFRHVICFKTNVVTAVGTWKKTLHHICVTIYAYFIHFYFINFQWVIQYECWQTPIKQQLCDFFEDSGNFRLHFVFFTSVQSLQQV